MRRAICRNIDKVHVGNVIAERIEIIVDGIPRHRHGAHIKARLERRMVNRVNHALGIGRRVHDHRLNRLQGLKHQANAALARILGNRPQHRGATRPRVLDRLIQKRPTARHHDLLGPKLHRDIHDILKVCERTGTRFLPARRDIPRLGVVLLGANADNPDPIPLRKFPHLFERIIAMAIDIQVHRTRPKLAARIARSRRRGKELLQVKVAMADIHNGKLWILHLVHLSAKGRRSTVCATPPLTLF